MLKENKSYFNRELAVTFSALGKKINRASAQPAQNATSLKPRSPGEGFEPLFSSLWAAGWAESQRAETLMEENIEMCQTVLARSTLKGGLWLLPETHQVRKRCRFRLSSLLMPCFGSSHDVRPAVFTPGALGITVLIRSLGAIFHKQTLDPS